MAHAPCTDCEVETAPDADTGWEWYMVHDHVWAEATKRPWPPAKFLCIGCLEIRLRRRLQPEDFTGAWVNRADTISTPRLRARREGTQAA